MFYEFCGGISQEPNIRFNANKRGYKNDISSRSISPSYIQDVSSINKSNLVQEARATSPNDKTSMVNLSQKIQEIKKRLLNLKKQKSEILPTIQMGLFLMNQFKRQIMI